MKIGKIIRETRLKKNMTKTSLCKLTGLNKGYVYRLENDLISPTVATLEKIAEVLEIPVSSFFIRAEYTAPEYSMRPDWDEAADSSVAKKGNEY